MIRSRFKTFVAAAAITGEPRSALPAAASGRAAASSAAPWNAGDGPEWRTASTVELRATRLGKNPRQLAGATTLYLFKEGLAAAGAVAPAHARSSGPARFRASGKARPPAGGVSASKLGTIKRSDGKPQVTYKRPPRSTPSSRTHGPEQTNGQGPDGVSAPLGSRWSAAGSQISGHAAGVAAALHPHPQLCLPLEHCAERAYRPHPETVLVAGPAAAVGHRPWRK